MASNDLSVIIDTNNAAFDLDSGGSPSQELARILRELAERIESDGPPGLATYRLTDINGNSVGIAEGGVEKP